MMSKIRYLYLDILIDQPVNCTRYFGIETNQNEGSSC